MGAVRGMRWAGLVGGWLVAGAALAQLAPPTAASSATAPVSAPASAAASAAAPELPYSDAVAARFPPPARTADTPGLQPGRSTYTSNEELSALLATLAQTPGVRRVAAGVSQRGTAIEALHFTDAANGEPGPSGAARPRVLLLGQQHGDEPAGSEALLALSRELAGGALAPLLQHIEVLVLPRANPDGAAFGLRVAMDGQDINRDHLLLRTPEATALATLARRFTPALVVDVHEHTVVGRYLQKFGAIQRHDLLLQHATAANLPPALAAATEAWFLAPLRSALDADGLTHTWYYTNPTTPGDLRLSMGGVQPDTLRNVQGLQHAVSILLESRGVGIGRLHLERRVHSHLVALRSLLHSAAERAPALAALQQALAQQVAAAACDGTVAVLAAQTPTRRVLPMLDPATGADLPLDVQWNSSLELRTLVQRPRPCGYWLAAEAGEAVARLHALGVRVQTLAAPQPLLAETWRETARVETDRPDVRGRIADARRALLVTVQTEPLALQAGAGSFYVGLDQPLAHLVVAALEPDTPSSYFANRLLPGLGSAARVLRRPASDNGSTGTAVPSPVSADAPRAASPARRE